MDTIILSSGRPSKQTTFDALPYPLIPTIKIVVPYHELKDYKQYEAYCKVLPTPEGMRGVGPTRQWIIENFGPKVLMLDDDLVFATRRADAPDKFRDATDDEITAMFKDMEILLDSHLHGGIATREGGNVCKDNYQHNVRMLRALAYRTDRLREMPFRFDDMDVMEDFHVTLSLLRRGHKNFLINYMVQNQNGSNLAGGCSQYRTDSMQMEAAHQLAETHFPFVSVIKKKTKIAWGGKERYDVRIQWKQAYKRAIHPLGE